VARARITGKWRRPIAEMTDEITAAAARLADCEPDLIVYHCTDSSMREDRPGEARIVEIIRRETGLEALCTSALVIEAMQALAIGAVVVVTPYESNEVIVRYLQGRGLRIVGDVALGIGGDKAAAAPPQIWLQAARANAHPEADGYFLACTNTAQIEAIEPIERALGKPVVNSNQAVLWACLERLRPAIGRPAASPELGTLMAQESPRAVQPSVAAG
jgi:maleate cis-trans isomerase